MDWYKRHPIAFFQATTRLSFEEKGAYSLVLDLIYQYGGRLPDDARFISGHLNCSLRKWASLRAALIGHKKIACHDGFISNSRADLELETYAKLSRKQAENASQPRKNNHLAEPPLSPRREEKREEREKTPTGSKSADVHELFPASGAPPGGKPAQPPKLENQARKIGTRLSPDWSPSEADRGYARSKGMGEERINRTGERFRNFWVAKAGAQGVKLDWSATWRNWVISDVERDPPKPKRVDFV